jgi:hypothetical protein
MDQEHENSEQHDDLACEQFYVEILLALRDLAVHLLSQAHIIYPFPYDLLWPLVEEPTARDSGQPHGAAEGPLAGRDADPNAITSLKAQEDQARTDLDDAIAAAGQAADDLARAPSAEARLAIGAALGRLLTGISRLSITRQDLARASAAVHSASMTAYDPQVSPRKDSNRRRRGSAVPPPVNRRQGVAEVDPGRAGDDDFEPAGKGRQVEPAPRPRDKKRQRGAVRGQATALPTSRAPGATGVTGTAKGRTARTGRLPGPRRR